MAAQAHRNPSSAPAEQLRAEDRAPSCRSRSGAACIVPDARDPRAPVSAGQLTLAVCAASARRVALAASACVMNIYTLMVVLGRTQVPCLDCSISRYFLGANLLRVWAPTRILDFPALAITKLCSLFLDSPDDQIAV